MDPVHEEDDSLALNGDVPAQLDEPLMTVMLAVQFLRAFQEKVLDFQIKTFSRCLSPRRSTQFARCFNTVLTNSAAGKGSKGN